MILKPGPQALPHMFLIGFRAPPGGMGIGGQAQKVGVVVAHDAVRFDGARVPPGPVRTADEPFAGQPAEGPFRFESQIATAKPTPDVIVVATAALVNAPFGSVRIDRGAGFGFPTALNFGWRKRTENPRKGLAGREGAIGDPRSLKGFDPAVADLPDNFDNAFNNGHNSPPVSPPLPFERDHELLFSDTTGPIVLRTLLIPPPPTLTVTENGQPLTPPLTLQPRVDTVVMDRLAQVFTVVWRASFSWQSRYETATLAVD
jgi:hypothetical protein